MKYDAWGRVIDLAAATPMFTGAGQAPAGGPNAAKRKRALSKGAALPPAGGAGAGAARFPIENASDLKKAVRMVQLAKGNKATIRKFIMAQAKKLGLTSLIPDHWNADGTVGTPANGKGAAPFATTSSSSGSTSGKAAKPD
jgi:hypothetical protein